jgi:formamidopyrimidine-DNA glycosylase
MPELPEVEFAARCLRRWAAGRRIVGAELDPRGRRLFRPDAPAAFARAVAGARVAAVSRRGKHLLLTLEKDRRALGVLSHLGMTGKWLRTADGQAPPGHSRARLRLDDGGTLHYQDPRLFGRLRLVPGGRFEGVPELSALGPDPLEQGIDLDRLAAMLGRVRLAVKPKLLDQRLLPGVGNIHAAEACFRARIDPRRPARSLTRAEVKRLAEGVLASFRMTLDAEQGPEITYVEEGGENPFLVYAREDERCPRCKRTPIRRVVQAGRSTFFCPRCQR